MLEDYPNLAHADEEAHRRFEQARGVDPFPEIPAALLNSADTYDYVRMTGMLYPFRPNKLKSASYEAGIHGACIWWDRTGQRHEINLGVDTQEFILRANSIAFVQVEPFFRIPDYIALRFNLKITHVHRGVLLGTGPLVDPGFVGRLLIPLHNLTNNDYRILAGEGLIWIEFTKTSSIPALRTAESRPSRRGSYIRFPPEKMNLRPEQYLSKAAPVGTIESSIPRAIEETREDAKRARSQAERLAYRLTVGGLVALLALVVALYGLWVQMSALVQDAVNVVMGVQQQVRQENQPAEQLRERLRAVEEKGSSLDERARAIERQLEQMRRDIKQLRGQSQ